MCYIVLHVLLSTHIIIKEIVSPDNYKQHIFYSLSEVAVQGSYSTVHVHTH